MVLEKVQEMLAEKLGIPAEEITADSEFSALGLDSLDFAEMLMTVESEFGVSVEMDASIRTVGALVEKLEALMDKS